MTLTPEQQAYLDKLVSEIRLDKITVSFSIEDRDIQGRKKSCFISETASRGHGAEMGQMNEDAPSANWTLEEAQIVHAVLSKQVITKTYRDAAHRGVISSETVREELPHILSRYDNNIVRILSKKSDGNGK